ncbi:MAG TPA: gliding motility protein GldC [Flavobacteriales bacterium]|nr:gliding motility protein GldC [Flavobacteriales bacterium]
MESKSEININVTLDPNKVPEKIEWKATDLNKGFEPVKGMLLSMWDANSQNSLRIDLWTKEMSVEEMKLFFHQTLVTMADTYERSTGDVRLSEDMRDFCFYFAKRTNIISEEEEK